MDSKHIALGILALMVVGIVFISTRQQVVTCNPPYIKVGTECCLDANGNGICDKDEKIQKPTKQPECGNGICEEGETFYTCGGIYPADCIPSLSLTNFDCRRIDNDNIEISYDVTNNADFDIYVALYQIILWTSITDETKSWAYKILNEEIDTSKEYFLLRPGVTLSKTYVVNVVQNEKPNYMYYGEVPPNIWIDFCIGPYVPDFGDVNSNYGVCFESGKNPC